jgi:tetratricopeptide (TPR) repeat protein
MARELAGALRARLGVGEGEFAEHRNVDPRAYEAYLRALERVSVRDEQDSRVEAIKQFRLAASIEPDFADAHAGHAYLVALSLPRQLGMTWPQLVAEQRRSNERALELDPDNPLGLVAKATALKNFDGDVDQALAIDRAVLKASPNFGPAHYSISASLWMRGQAREALDHLDQAIDRDPFDRILPFYRGKILYSLGDYDAIRDESIKCQGQCLALGWYWLLAMAGFATPEQFRQDYPALRKQALATDIPAAVIDEAEAMAEAFIERRPFKPRLVIDPVQGEFPEAAITARFISFDAGLRFAHMVADRGHADGVLDLLNDGRVTFTPEQRADPRYHALFRHPKIVEIAAARRKEGVTAGLPIFPVKPYTGR